jgi:hypothetical protein
MNSVTPHAQASLFESNSTLDAIKNIVLLLLLLLLLLICIV